MDILDGRRAVPGDLVECINDNWSECVGAPSEDPKIGDRFYVKARLEPGEFVSIEGEGSFVLDKVQLVFVEEPQSLNNAARFRIIPADQKAKENIAFRTKEKV
jgi:hypothetical protein